MEQDNKKYSYIPYGEEFINYAIIHTEGEVETSMAITDTAEKADFIAKACNQFDYEKYEKEQSAKVIEMNHNPEVQEAMYKFDEEKKKRIAQAQKDLGSIYLD